MYEEEEFSPRSQRLPSAHMRMASPDINLQMEAYLTNIMAMSAMVAGNNDSWRRNDVHTQFAHFFPNANRQAQQIFQSMSRQLMPESMPVADNSVFPTFSHDSSHQRQERIPSFSSAAPSIPDQRDEMSPSESNPETPTTDAISPDFLHSVNADSPMDVCAQTAFITELPAKANMPMAGGMTMSDPFSESLYGQDRTNNGPYYDFSNELRVVKGDSGMDMHTDVLGNDGIVPAKLEQQEINWDSFVN
jgi:hypothetical protein